MMYDSGKHTWKESGIQISTPGSISINVTEPGFPILYLIMRSDLASMNTGKAIAQGSHAANCAAKKAEIENPSLYAAWAGQASGQHFGTVVVLSCRSLDMIRDLTEEAMAISVIGNNSLNETVAGIVLDSTYPLDDGAFRHHIPLETCGFVMCNKGSKVHDLIRSKKTDFPLHK